MGGVDLLVGTLYLKTGHLVQPFWPLITGKATKNG